MQRDRQADAHLLARLDDRRHDAGGRQRDAPLRQGQALAVGGDSHRLADIVVIVERLAHAHQHDIGHQPAAIRHDRAGRGRRVRQVAEPLARRQDLADDLVGQEVAHQALGAGVAEGAGQGAADLAGDAQRAAAFLGNVDGLDLDRPPGAAGRKAEQPFAGAVDRDLLVDHFRPGDRIGLVQRLAQGAGDIRHLREIGDAAHIEPVPQLRDAHADLLVRHADGGQRLAEGGAVEADPRRLLVTGHRHDRRRGTRAIGGVGEIERDGHSVSFRRRRAGETD